ncbi:MAG: cyclase family protein [Frankia sp.]|nr:cyclase family protein [Frankia sp.]
MPGTRRIVDLSHPISDGTVTYPGLPAPSIRTHTTRESSGARFGTGVSFHIAKITMVANTGTYLDAPFHFHDDGPDVAELPLERLVDVPAVLVRALGRRAVEPDAFPEPERLAGHAVLVHTGHAVHWGSDRYFGPAPYLAAATVDLLVSAGVLLVGIDSLNIDNVDDPHRPAHHNLLGANIPIIEHLTALDQLPDDEPLRLTALPARVRGMGTFPVRAVALVG